MYLGPVQVGPDPFLGQTLAEFELKFHLLNHSINAGQALMGPVSGQF